MNNVDTPQTVEQWGHIDVIMHATVKGNPFVDVRLCATFTSHHAAITVDGFYDGNGLHILRFMPTRAGDWMYKTSSNIAELDGITGKITCLEPSKDNHGPVRVADTYHFQYADGTRYHMIGSTAYGSLQQPETVYQKTLQSLKQAPFNKLRVVLLPHAPSGQKPVTLPFEGEPHHWDLTRFKPEFFQLFEKRLLDLQQLGIEADVILFHPYDAGVWGLEQMNAHEQGLYLKYVNARLGPLRHVWWSMANEYDLMEGRSESDWNRCFQFFSNHDPYQHLRSIHNAAEWYDHSQPWVTHVSCQTENWWQAEELRRKYKKPIIFDEFCYEGDDCTRIAALPAFEVVHRYWLMTVAGCYATHGEGYHQPDGRQFFRQGGQFIGESAQHIAWLKEIMASAPGPLTPIWTDWRLNHIVGHVDDEFLLYYLGVYQNTAWRFDELAEGVTYTGDIIDTWNMTISPVAQPIRKGTKLQLPGKPYFAMRLRRKA